MSKMNDESIEFEAETINKLLDLTTKRLLDNFFMEFDDYANNELIPRFSGMVDYAVDNFEDWRIQNTFDKNHSIRAVKCKTTT